MSARRPLGVQVGSHCGEEPARDRDQPLPAALALGDEHPTLRGPQVTQPQPQHLTAAQPASTIAATIARSRCVRSAAVSASTSAGDKIRGSRRVTRTSGTPWRGRDRSRRVGSPRGTGLAVTSPRACKNAKNPDTIDSRRRTVAADTPPGAP